LVGWRSLQKSRVGVFWIEIKRRRTVEYVRQAVVRMRCVPPAQMLHNSKKCHDGWSVVCLEPRKGIELAGSGGIEDVGNTTELD
jgi:hypothetical protein